MPRRGFFRHILVVGFCFALACAAIVAFVLHWSEAWAKRQIDNEVMAELDDLEAFHEQRRMLALTDLVRERGAFRSSLGAVYLLTLRSTGARLAGNAARWPAEARESVAFAFPLLDADGDPMGLTIHARARVINGAFNLLVGRAIEPRLTLARDFTRLLPATAGVLALLGLLACAAIGRALLRRVEALNAVARAVEGGAMGLRAPDAERQDEFGDLARHFNRMLDRLEALIAATKATTDRVAHELRTPMTRLRVKLRAAAKAADGPTRALIADAIDETAKLSSLYDALLDLSRIEARAGDGGGLAPVELGALISEARDLYLPAAEAAGIAIDASCDDEIILRGDRMLLLRLIINLLDNALKFSPPLSRVGLAARRDGACFVLVVSDEGPGLDPAFAARAFEPFSREQGAAEKDGFGLGLAIAHAICRRHGFAIRLAANGGHGLRVEVDGASA